MEASPARLVHLRIATQAALLGALVAMPAPAREAAVPAETVRAAGLRAPAEVRIDRWGVAHIYARSEPDVFFAQGWNAARDRLFQIDLWRRRGLGQLAEVLGPEFVEQDRAARLFLYRGDMDREWRTYSSRGTREAEPVAQRFVEGINAYVDWLPSNPTRMPWEFAFLGYRPAKWSAEDVIRIRSHGLTRNLLSEVARSNTLCKAKDVDADQVRFGLTNDWKAQVPEGLDPCLPEGVLKVFQFATQGVLVQKSAAKGAQASLGVAPLQVTALEEEAAPDGSNSWVVGPSKSATRRPIMANDPHRAYSAPSLRYIVHLSAPGLDVGGMPVAISAGLGLTRLRLKSGLDPALPERHIVLAGVRDLDPLEQDLLDRSAVELLSVEDIKTRPAAIAGQMKRLSSLTDVIYVHVDMDVLDPPEVAGIR